jgi:hypothetical protein
MRRLDRWAVTALLFAAACGAPIASVSWNQATPRSGEVVGDSVRIESPVAGGTFPLISFAPTIPRGEGYVVEGKIRYQGVAGTGYLEMWSDFPGSGRYFSRTLEPTGPQGVIAEDSDWRDFQIPFSADGAPSPARLDINLVLSGPGTVEIGPLRVFPLGSGSAWWSDRTAGKIGAGAGVVIGLIGATMGVFAGRRKSRRLVLTAMVVLLVAGIGSLLGAGIGFVSHQPYEVVFPLLLLGAICVGVFGGGYRATRKGYEEAELRKMHALDAMSSRPG